MSARGKKILAVIFHPFFVVESKGYTFRGSIFSVWPVCYRRSDQVKVRLYSSRNNAHAHSMKVLGWPSQPEVVGTWPGL